MCEKGQRLRVLVNERLTAAAQEIFALFERTIAEYEEELCRSKEENKRKQQLLDSVLSPQVLLHRTDFGRKDQPCQELKQENPALENENEENHTQEFSFTAVTVKSEDTDEEKSSLLHQILTESKEEKSKQEYILNHNGQNENSSDSDNNEECTRETMEADGDDDEQIHKVIIDNSAKLHECLVCGKTFQRGSALKRHTVVHTGEKPYSCPVCTKGFTQKGHLKVHMCSHTGLKPFNCSICHKGFTRKKRFREHVASHKGRKLSPVCDSGFRQKLNPLQKIKTKEQKKKEKLFSCLECHTAFSSNLNLIRHMALHSGEKPFSCSFCQKGFICKKDIDKHMKIHTGDETGDDRMEYITQ